MTDRDRDHETLYLSEKEIAKITGITMQTLRNHRCQGRGLPYIKLRRLVRYSLSDVLSYMESRKIIPES